MNLTDKVILLIFVFATLTQLVYWIFIFGKLVRYNLASEEPHTSLDAMPPVSVIICAHNEADNLNKNLRRFLNQNYRSYEVLLVDHKSTDTTKNILAYLQSEFSHLRVVECDDPGTGKKIALAKGIEQSKNDILLLSDADCAPASEFWLQRMVAGLDKEPGIALGFSPYSTLPGPLNKFIRYEACYTAIQYMSFALSRLPYMGVGRNLAYRKELFRMAGGFQKHSHYASGDDDLFINEVAANSKVVIRLHPDSFVFSTPKTTLKSYIAQKSRHFSTGKLYKLHHKFFLAVLTMSHFLHFFGGLYIILKISIIFAIVGYAVRISVVMMIGSRILNRFQQRSLIPWLPVFDVLFVFFYMMFSPVTLMNINAQKWN
jgi:cellulose synthase/poly-beta-1,6-N-acetylglucosamine synthase-like glycosyltransferase